MDVEWTRAIHFDTGRTGYLGWVAVGMRRPSEFILRFLEDDPGNFDAHEELRRAKEFPFEVKVAEVYQNPNGSLEGGVMAHHRRGETHRFSTEDEVRVFLSQLGLELEELKSFDQVDHPWDRPAK